ncbi:Uncharacterized protein OBRU01_18345 [Operophtera brumata]|uniref:WSCD family member AGAP003962 n=1 Tax=Operophtera brumata TaxID=104452 RepID=A0A0L7KYU6_OPEBR|nr:Uncharacterized protein OBRU01_18345 [Operophtera brumata]
MSRRSIFLLAAAVVLLYFSIILFMSSPLHSTRGSYYDHLSLRQIPVVNWCKELQWRSPTSNVTALVSYPGSGNTWLRYLLQQVTGILTGSIYMDYGLRVHGFPAENVTGGSVLVVKTHEAPPLDLTKFKSAVLLIRNPRDAILADMKCALANKEGIYRRKKKHKDFDPFTAEMYQALTAAMIRIMDTVEERRNEGESYRNRSNKNGYYE